LGRRLETRRWTDSLDFSRVTFDEIGAFSIGLVLLVAIGISAWYDWKNEKK